MITCPECGRMNADDAKICVYCGTALVDLVKETAATRSFNDTDFEEGVPKWGSARFGSKMNLIVNVEKSPENLTFDADEIEELVIGRIDPDTGERPEIDLTDFGALDKGVSRRHAAIIRKDGSLQVVDRGSPNGTFLNGQKLVSNQPRVLRDGDDIRLGYLVIRISFQKA
ncbi:MAG: FHA domain-containing protein [bacterium]|nr:FHA domain-containing protein [bacterium]